MQSAMFGGALLVALASSTVEAQAASREQTLDLTIGIGGVMRGEYLHGAGAALDALFSVPAKRHLRWGGSVSTQLGLDVNTCIARPPSSECMPEQPLIVSYAALVGSDWQPRTHLAVRAYAGPSLHRYYRRGSLALPDAWLSFGGLSGRIDLTTIHAVNLLVSMRASLVPALPRNARGTVAIGFGLGIH